MKTILNWLALCFVVVLFAFATGCSRDTSGVDYVLFDWFEYKSTDPAFEKFPTGTGEFQNPLLPGFYPDPSICRVDSDYYLINSTFSYFPGIPIFHSRDLVHWEQIGHVLDRPSQLNLDSLELSWGVFAPAISYHQGKYYVINTIVNGGGNFYVTATSPAGPWSDPVWFPEIDGIDPSFFFDENGKAYVVNNGPPEGAELYQGHRAIWIQEFSIDSGKLTGPRKVIVNAGVDIAKQPIWIEGPHVFKKNGYYYLIAAEGGTSTGHSEVVFRSKSVWGPYIPWKNNPILTQRHLDPGREFPVSSTGHADFVETQNGEWWAVFLGCRPYADDFYNTGRETFMLPVTWKDGWPFVTRDPVPYTVKRPALPDHPESGAVTGGNFTWRDEFNDTTLGMKWNFIRTPREKWYSLTSDSGFLRLDIRPVAISELKNPSFIGRRQQHAHFSASASLHIVDLDTTETAGLIAFQNEKHYLYLGVRKMEENYVVFAERRGSDAENGQPEMISAKGLAVDQPSAIRLKIEGHGATYDFYYALEDEEWTLLQEGVNAKNLSTNMGGGFVGTYLGMYASGNHFSLKGN